MTRVAARPMESQVALVTGAASGMGRALAVLLGQQGMRLGLLDRNGPALETLAGELKASGALCAWTVADVSSRTQTHEAIRQLADSLGPVDLLVACAGITGATLVDDLAVEASEAILAVNLLGTMYTIEAVLPSMLQRGHGHLVAISSLAGIRGMPFAAAYGASKAGLAAYLESLRPALRLRGIQVTTIFPGFVDTPLMQNAPVQPSLPMISAERAARAILKAIVQRRKVYSFPLSTTLLVSFLALLPAGIYDWMMQRAARSIRNLRY